MNSSKMKEQQRAAGSKERISDRCLTEKKGEDLISEKANIDQNANTCADLPFLVTHWINGLISEKIKALNNSKNDSHDKASTKLALDRIHAATSEIASGFSELGLFGSDVVQHSFSHVQEKSSDSSLSSTHRSYADLSRQWSRCCPKNQLELLLSSAKSSIAAVDTTVSRHKHGQTNLMLAASEAVAESLQKPKSGRTLNDAINISDNHDKSNEEHDNISILRSVSLLQPPTLIVLDEKSSEADSSTKPEGVPTDLVIPAATIHVASSYRQIVKEAAEALRSYLDLNAKHQNSLRQMKSMKKSLEYQKCILNKLNRERSAIIMKQSVNSSQDTIIGATTSRIINISSSSTIFNNSLESFRDGHQPYENSLQEELNKMDLSEQNCKRVIALLQRQLPSLTLLHETNTSEMIVARRKSKDLFVKSKAAQSNYRDPVPLTKGKERFSNNRILFNVQLRQSGFVNRVNGSSIPRSMGRLQHLGGVSEVQKSLVYNRFLHAATINCHLHYPIYCLRFDRTGRYFITGADDYLVRVFCLGGNITAKPGTAEPALYSRGAVLVCTLKGHAGVVNDICVSSDNSFLATASEDGDCRVWGLKDGCPVAILRGHHGGANMVSWSTLTPYRLVTTSADGLARIWDVREACLNRYGSLLEKRPEYLLKIKGKPLTEMQPNDHKQVIHSQSDVTSILHSPSQSDNVEEYHSHPLSSPLSVLLPVLPLPATGPGIDEDVTNNETNSATDNNTQPGRFIANDLIDEGVKLISKLQHGASLDERAQAPGTRARRAAVKVICVARCPFGGHFATGSDDGICRIWKDDDDLLVEKVDAAFSQRRISTLSMRYSTRKSTDKLLLVLKGHLSAITDLIYSSAGNRILTASQKDGIVRIWSWSHDPCYISKPSVGSPQRGSQGGHTSQILIKLTNPQSVTTSGGGMRRRMNRSANANVSCDVATWIQDDSKIVTSQSELVKPNGSEIVPGSHYFFLWDSFTGHCLLGVNGAHTMQCPVLISHPIDPSIMCSAGADGVVKLWDWETCKCFYSYTNTADFGPLEPNERGKQLGYLDGSFSPDGATMVLTDDSGRVTIFDCSGVRDEDSRSKATYPDWMKEQYFSNDYYDLNYDASGYCVERGSEQPPHLAPRGSRCSHTGAPFPDRVTEALLYLSGPIPFAADSARWTREEIRRKSELLTETTRSVRGNSVCQFDPKSTILIQHGLPRANPKVSFESADLGDAEFLSSERRAAPSNESSVRMLSSNWRWGDAYADDIRANEDDPDPDSDDEEFQLNEGRIVGSNTTPSATRDDGDEFFDQDDELDDDLSPQVRRQHTTSSGPSRAVSKRKRRLYEEQDSDGDLDEFMSTNNNPSGPFVADYDIHFFKMPSRGHISRSWVRRSESTSSYAGRKKYTPQIGDLVVYIPRAHFDTILQFPSLCAPWQNWPDNAVWPVVQCRIKNIRYRFPFADFWSSNSTGHVCRSVVAILTVEIIGIPELSSDRLLPWPTPTFMAPTAAHTFEIRLFENQKTDFILPSALYAARIKDLEKVAMHIHHDRKPKVYALYATENTAEDVSFDSYFGEVHSVNHRDDDNGDPNMSGSGYNTVEVEWESDPGKCDHVHPWELCIKSQDEPLEIARPQLDASEVKMIRDALNKVKAIDSNFFFLYPVDENRYSDYLMRVEVPMDLTFMFERLESNYYATKFSAVADMKLIVDNCIKYNGEHDELSDLARKMLEVFEGQLLSHDEREDFHRHNVPLSIESKPRLPLQTGLVSAQSFSETRSRTLSSNRVDTSLHGQINRRGQVSRSHAQVQSERRNFSRTSLEALPPPSFGSNVGRSDNALADGSVARNISTRGRSVESRNVGRSVSSNSTGRRTRNRSQLNGGSGSLLHSSTRTSNIGFSGNLGSQTNRDNTAQNVRSPSRFALTDTLRQGRNSRAFNGSVEPTVVVPVVSRVVVSNVARLATSATKQSREEPLPSNVDSFGHEVDSASVESQLKRSERGNASTRVKLRIPLVKRDLEYEENGQDRPVRPRRVCSKVISRDNDEESCISDNRRRKPPSTKKTCKSRFTVDSDVEDHSSASASEDQRETDSSSDAESVLTHDSSGSEEEGIRDRNGEATSPFRITKTRTSSKRISLPRKKSNEALQHSSPSQRKRKTIRNEHSLSPSRKPRASVPPVKSYVDPDSSDIDFDSNTSSDDSDNSLQAKRTSKHRNVRTGNVSSGKKRKVVPVESRGVAALFQPKEWPEINKRKIPQVTRDIINCLKELDEDGLFTVPVLEMYPQHETMYKKLISKPMDFRTILKSRVDQYESIKGLREDLVLIFHNCIRFNGPRNQYGQFARTMLEQLYDIFTQICHTHCVNIDGPP